MQIVIDIPEEDYNFVKKQVADGITNPLKICIANGIPLPKYGRLIEINTVQSMARKKAEDCFPEGRYAYGYRKALFDFAKDIDGAPTIIADTESECEG